MNYTITPGSETDLPEVMDIEVTSFNSPWTARMFMDEMENGFSYLLVARDPDGTLLGFICVWVIVDELHILNVAVRPMARRRGIGRALVDEDMRMALNMGASKATLEVRSENKAAVSLYLGMGFIEAGLRRGYYDLPPDDAVIMWHYVIGRDY